MKEIELENFSNSKIPILLWFSLYLKKIRIYIFLKILQINSYDCLHSWLFNYIFINRFWKKSLLMWFFHNETKRWSTEKHVVNEIRMKFRKKHTTNSFLNWNFRKTLSTIKFALSCFHYTIKNSKIHHIHRRQSTQSKLNYAFYPPFK